MSSIEDVLSNLPPSSDKYIGIEENSSINFCDFKEELKRFIDSIKSGYTYWYDFPNFIRISRGNRKRMVAEFTPYSIKWYASDIKSILLNSNSMKPYIDYLNGEIKINAT